MPPCRLLPCSLPLMLALSGAACAGTEGGARAIDSSNAAGSSAQDDSQVVLASSAECAPHRDATTTETPEISIRNTGSVPLYVLSKAPDCGTAESLVEVWRDGEQLDVLPPSPCRHWSCAEFLDASLGSALLDKRGGCSCHRGVQRRLLGPQQTLQQSVYLELVPRELPSSCSGQRDTLSCVARVLPGAGNYTIVVHATADRPCVEPLPPDAGLPIAAPAASCPEPTPPLTFTLPTGNYFQDQEIEISAR